MDESANPWKLAGGLTALCVSVLLGGALFVVSAARPERVKPVTSFARFSANDKSFSCQYPEGWKKKSMEAAAVISSATFRQGGAMIDVTADLQGSLMGDVMTAQQNMGGGMDGGEFGGGGMPDLAGAPGGVGEMTEAGGGRKSVIEKLHDMSKDRGVEGAAACGFTEDYEEQPPQPFQSSMGPALISEFTADGGFIFGKGRGYRATFQHSEKLVTVVCAAPERDWAAVNKAFQQTLASLAPG